MLTVGEWLACIGVAALLTVIGFLALCCWANSQDGLGGFNGRKDD